jgi:hypothetical protein
MMRRGWIITRRDTITRRTVNSKGWSHWFLWATRGSGRGPMEPWIAYMKDDLIRECFNIADESVMSFEIVRMEHSVA